MPVKKCIIRYHRIDWLAGPMQDTFEKVVRDCLDELTTSQSTQMPFNDGLAGILNRRLDQNATKLHIAKWVEDEPSSTVPHEDVDTSAEINLSEAPPGADWDYLDQDNMVLISGNHFLSVSANGFQGRTAANYLRSLLKLARKEYNVGVPRDFETFQLREIANPDTTRQIREEGVKKIDLDVSQYFATANRQAGRSTIIKNITQAIVDMLITRDEDRRQIEEAANVHAKLVVSIDTRKRLGLTPENLVSTTEQIMNEDSGLATITTGQGTKIKRDKLILNKQVELVGENKTVDHLDAWSKLEQYYQELWNSDRLER